MKKTIITAILIIIVALLFVVFKSQNTSQETKNLTISWAEFQEKEKNENAIVIDIRTAGEIAEGKLFDDVIVDFDYYQQNYEQKISELDPTKTYLIYCRSGNRSGKSLKIFEKYGLKVYDLDEGIKGVNNLNKN